MEILTILVDRLYKSVTPTNYFFKVPLVGPFMPLVSEIGRLVEPPHEAYITYEPCIKTTKEYKFQSPRWHLEIFN